MAAKQGSSANPGLLETAKRLRATQKACRRFLALWALEEDKKARIRRGQRQASRFTDPMNHDWSLLYLETTLDD